MVRSSRVAYPGSSPVRSGLLCKVEAEAVLISSPTTFPPARNQIKRVPGTQEEQNGNGPKPEPERVELRVPCLFHVAANWTSRMRAIWSTYDYHYGYLWYTDIHWHVPLLGLRTLSGVLKANIRLPTWQDAQPSVHFRQTVAVSMEISVSTSSSCWFA